MFFGLFLEKDGFLKYFLFVGACPAPARNIAANIIDMYFFMQVTRKEILPMPWPFYQKGCRFLISWPPREVSMPFLGLVYSLSSFTVKLPVHPVSYNWISTQI